MWLDFGSTESGGEGRMGRKKYLRHFLWGLKSLRVWMKGSLDLGVGVWILETVEEREVLLCIFIGSLVPSRAKHLVTECQAARGEHSEQDKRDYIAGSGHCLHFGGRRKTGTCISKPL